jgi:hypothetical protein
MRGGERWNDPELAFADWIVRGLESRGDEVPRLSPPRPGILERVPVSRGQVQAALEQPSDEYFGAPLCAALRNIEGDAAAQRRLWLVEAALGNHYLEAAGRLEPVALRPVLLDDWLAEYEQYARAVANPPSGAGNLWRLSEAGWSRDPLVRLSAAAQALQCDDGCAFGSARDGAEPLVWKQRGRVRLPLLRAPGRVVLPPLQGFRAALRAIDVPQIQALVEQAAAGGAHLFEARALWPRILARLLASGAPVPEPGPSLPAVQPIEAHGVYESYDSYKLYNLYTSASEALRALLGERGGWVPRVLAPRPVDTVAESRPQASLLLVHGSPLNAAGLLGSRRLAAELPVRGAVFLDSLGRGAAYELLPDQPDPLDPRYREELWTASNKLPTSFDELIALTDEATSEGRLTTPLSHLLAMMGVGLEECLYAVSGTGPTG